VQAAADAVAESERLNLVAKQEEEAREAQRIADEKHAAEQ